MGFGHWYRTQKAGVQIAVAGGIVVVVGGVVIGVLGVVGAALARPGAQIPTSAPAPALTTPASALVTSSPSAPAASTPASTAPATGTITDPRNGATNVSTNEELLVSGTAQNIPAGYSLDVFLQFAGHTRYYAPANPDNPAPLINGHWSATIFISEAQPIILWLVVLSPADMSVTNNELAYQSTGYPSLPGTKLASVRFTARASP
jgi:hypothetical protein